MLLEELKLDSEEFMKLIQIATRSHVKSTLEKSKSELDREIFIIEEKERKAAIRAAENQIQSKKYVAELTEYAWDQSVKFVKLFVTVLGVQFLNENAVILNLSDNSMCLHVNELNGKDYILTVNHLLEPIDAKQSYRKIKNDIIAIYLKKVNVGKHWSHLTSTEQRLTKKNDDELNSDTETPEKKLVNFVKKMYNEGNSKTKEMIAKAFTENRPDECTGGSAYK